MKFKEIKNKKRLTDRGFRRGIPAYRKNVFRIFSNNNTYILIKILNKKYKPIWNKNIKGVNICQDLKINAQRLIQKKETSLELLVSDVGENIAEFKEKKIPHLISLGIIELKKLNQHKQYKLNFHLPRYLKKLLTIKKDGYLREFDCVFKISSELSDIKIENLYGYGLEDPSITNFCYKDKKVSLIDFDNFRENINFEYELGFMTADLLFINKIKFSNQKNLENYFFKFIRDEYKKIKVDDRLKIQFFTGMLSLFSTLMIDYKNKEGEAKIKLRAWKISIFVLCRILSATTKNIKTSKNATTRY